MKFTRFARFTMVIALLFAMPFYISNAQKGKQMYYEIKIYRFNSPSQVEATDNYLKNAFIPASHRAGITNIGVFKPVEADTAFGKMVYVFIPYKTPDEYFKLVGTLESDQTYQQAGKAFLDADVKAAPFTRYESVFLKAFAFMPQMKTFQYSTPASERIYELRSYESATEAKALKKIHMFNEGGETKIFEAIGSNAVFYGQVLLGSQKPRLMYLTTYADMKTHDEKWNAFRNHPDWKKLSSMEEYKNSTSKTKAFLCHPTDYSDF